MRLHVASRLPFPREVVFRAYRDRLVELVPHLPNVRAIERESRLDEPPRTRIVSIWRGGGEVPAIARGVLSEKMLAWHDFAEWDEARLTCAWRMRTHAFPEAVRAEGENRFLDDDGGGTELVVEGELAIDGRALPVPRLLAGSVARAAERFLIARIEPNLRQVAEGLAQLLAAR